MQTMYPGQVNSPQTELATAIDSIQTSFDVLDGSVLPDAPNIAVIGQDEDAETILYESKVGNTISNVTRGFQGTASSWSAGVKIARNFTAYDWDAIRQNFDEHKADTATGAHKAKNIAVEDVNNRFTATDVEGVLNELFTFANDGKTSIASVIGSPATSGDTFSQLQTHIQNAKNTMATNLSNKGVAASGTEALQALANKIANVNTGKKWASGSTNVTEAGNYDYVQVTGLSFTPTLIFVRIRNTIDNRDEWYIYENIFTNYIVSSSQTRLRSLKIFNNASSISSTYDTFVNFSNISNGFKLNLGNIATNASSLVADWYVFE